MMQLKKIALKSKQNGNELVHSSVQHSLHGLSYLGVNQNEILAATIESKCLEQTKLFLSSSLNGTELSGNVGSYSDRCETSINIKQQPPPVPPLTSLTPPSWVNNFRDVYNENRHFAKHWFWDNFNWETQSIWIGKFNKSNNLPDNNRQIADFLQRLVTDLNRDPKIKSQIYIKFYFSRNVKTNDPEINYLLICNGTELPQEFSGTLVDITFEKYQLTENILNKDKDFKRMLNHYLNWSNFYIYYNLMEELQY